MRKILFTLIAFSLLTLQLSAQDTRSKNKFFWWRNDDVRKELELSIQQVEKIEEIFQSFKQQIHVLRGELENKENSLRQILQSPEVPRDEVLKLTNEVEQIKARGRMMKVDMLLDIREVLTSEQRSQLHKIKHNYLKGTPENTHFRPIRVLVTFSS